MGGQPHAPDGVIEAMEHPGRRFVLSVQWHPENHQGQPCNFDPLFDAFVESGAPSVDRGR